ncbi:hypothetical protein D910_03782 [Dendroctonus ponderosae]
MKPFSRKIHWLRVKGYINRYATKEHIQSFKNVSLTTISFLAGFFFYQKIIKDLILEKEYDCRCGSNPKAQQRISKKVIKKESYETQSSPK